MGRGDGYRRYPPCPDAARCRYPRAPAIPVVSPGSLAAWLGEAASRDALLTAWHAAPCQPLAGYETGALAAAARAGKTRTPITIAIPGGRSRLPLLAAVHAAVLRLPG